MIAALLHGTVLAFGLILPLGPQNVFVLSQGATQPNLLRALPVVAAAALSDTLLIVLAVLGVSAVVLTVSWVKIGLMTFGILFLAYVGWVTWQSDSEPGGTEGEASSWPLRRRVGFALTVSLLNPHAILDTVGVIGASSLAYADDAKRAFTVACILVSWLWFLLLALAGRLVGTFQPVRRLLNRVSAVIMWVSAAYLASSLGAA